VIEVLCVGFGAGFRKREELAVMYAAGFATMDVATVYIMFAEGFVFMYATIIATMDVAIVYIV